MPNDRYGTVGTCFGCGYGCGYGTGTVRVRYGYDTWVRSVCTVHGYENRTHVPYPPRTVPVPVPVPLPAPKPVPTVPYLSKPLSKTPSAPYVTNPIENMVFIALEISYGTPS